MTDLQSLCGLVVASDQFLHQARSVRHAVAPDVTVTTGSPLSGHPERAVARTMLDFGIGNRHIYSVSELADGSYLLRFDGACEFVMSPDLRRVTAYPIEDAAGLTSVLTVGGLLACQLYLRGHVVLHASAVDVGGMALAFVGHSGMGKSTMAALLCTRGARVITDDVLRVDVEPGPDGRPLARARLGATGLRLRRNAVSLRDEFASPPAVMISADDRQVLQLDGGADDCLPLAAIVVPQPDRTRSEIEVVPISGKDAVFALLQFPRLLGWRDESIVKRQLEHAVALAGAVPIVLARVPWGPPFAAELAGDLLTAVLGARQSMSSSSSGDR